MDGKGNGQEVEYLIENAKEDVDCNIKAVVNWNGSDNECVKYYDKNGNCSETIPNYEFDDKDFQIVWDDFKNELENLTNLLSILSILESGESIQAGDLILSRV